MAILLAVGLGADPSLAATPAANPLELFPAGSAPVRSSRPYTVADTLARRSFAAIRPNPVLPLVALQVERPRTIGEDYVTGARSLGDLHERRSDLVVISIETRGVVFDSRTLPERASASSATWSPSGRRLAFLAVGPDGATRLMVWDVGDRRLSTLAAPGVRRGTPFRFPDGDAEIRSALAWADEDTVLAVAAGDDPRALGPRRVADLAAAWTATWRGEASTRVWSTEDLRPCRQQERLVVFDLPGGASRSISTPGLKGVSIARDGRRAVLVRGLPRDSLAYRGRAAFAPQANLWDYEPTAPWTAEIIDLRSAAPARPWIASAEGPVSASTLPRWSEDGRRLFTLTRATQPAHAPVTLRVLDLADGRTQSEVYETLPAAQIAGEYRLAGRAPPPDLKVARRPGPGWTSEPAPELVTLPGGGLAYIIGGALVLDRPGAAIHRTVLPPADLIRRSGADGAALLVLGPSPAVAAAALPLPVERRAPPAAGAIFDGFAAGDLGIFHADLAGGSFAWAVGASGAPVELARTNLHIAEITTPRSVDVPYQVGGARRTGVLYYPTAGARPGRPPLVVHAYPGQSARNARRGDLLNADHSWFVQNVLAHGFAVFVPDFRLAGHGDGAKLTDRVLGELDPALAAIRPRTDVDTRRIGFLGHSNGGITALILLARTKAFSAIVASAPLGDFAQYGRTVRPELSNLSCAPAVRLDSNQELEDPDNFMSFTGPVTGNSELIAESPLNGLAGVKTPTLLVAGEFDLFAASAEQVYLALAEMGAPAELALYRAEGHNLAAPGNVEDAAGRIVGWLERYLTADPGAP